MPALMISSRDLRLPACSLSLSNIRSILEVLDRKNHEAADLQVSRFVPPHDMSEQNVVDLHDQIRKAHVVTITVEAKSGKRFFGHGPDYLDTPELPEDIVLIYADSSTHFATQANGAKPESWFSLLLDFSKPPLMDWVNPLYAPTPNNSNFHAEGINENWLSSVIQIVEEKTNERKNYRGWLHRSFVYDTLLMILGMPLTFWLLEFLGPHVDSLFVAHPAIVTNAAYVYLFLTSLWTFRILFGYTKWAWPKVELLSIGSKTSQHRKFWGALAFAIVSGILLKLILG